MSFFLIKLMQAFDGVEFDGEALHPEARPREEWKGAEGRKGRERMWPWSHLTLYVKVSLGFGFGFILAGVCMGADELVRREGCG